MRPRESLAGMPREADFRDFQFLAPKSKLRSLVASLDGYDLRTRDGEVGLRFFPLSQIFIVARHFIEI